jgi:diketogulonate reductase-like aldo/keto reductase
MLQRIIPSTGEKLPVIGLGSWIKFDVDAHSPELENLKQTLELMHQQGARLIDSSPMYGKAENMIGELTQETGFADYFFYATKVWTSGKHAGIQQMQDSMQKMRRPVMDLVQIHNLVDWQTQLTTLREWKAAARIRYIGITHYQTSFHAQLEQILQQEKVDFVQFNYSIATRHAEKTLLPVAMNQGVAVIINEPLEKGKLFAKVRERPLPEWASEYDIKNWAEFFLKYIISHPAVTCVIPASSNPRHVSDNLVAGKGIMPDNKGRKKMAAHFDAM